MARTFSSKDTIRLIEEHQNLRRELNNAIDMSERYANEVIAAVDAITSKEVITKLADISIDEINRNKKGFRVKTLKDRGYNTIADVYGKSSFQLSSINGISPEAGRGIVEEVRAISAEAQKTVKIKLSADNKTKEYTRLITAISKYKRSEKYIEICGKIVAKYGAEIADALHSITPLTKGLGWYFTSRLKKEKAENAFGLLMLHLEGEYGNDSRMVLSGLQAIGASKAEDCWRDFEEDPIGFSNVLEKLAAGTASGEERTVYGLPTYLAEEIQNEVLNLEGLKCSLRNYQEWGVKYTAHQRRVLLGDEMGLGKTVQAIAAMVNLRNKGASHFLVVCPASVMSNWCREISKMSNLDVICIHGSDKQDEITEWLYNGGVAVTTYETTGAIKLSDIYKFAMLVVDEAHYIKNPQAKRSQNVMAISEHAENVLFMTGTALENKVEEMMALIKILRPDIFAEVSGMTFLASAPEFREKVAPVYYRRKREDVLTELPELLVEEEWCTLLRDEELAYERAVLSRNYPAARRVSWNVDDLSKSSKALRLLDIVQKAGEEGRKVIVFTFFLDTMNKVMSLLGDCCIGPINGSVSPERRQQLVDEFNDAPPGYVLAAQIQAGGTGLNIQAASVVVLCEPQFKPSIENQAISRAYRMGQTRNVLVFRLLADDTVDEKIYYRLLDKQREFDAFADQSVAADESAELDEKSFGSIIEEEYERISAKNTSPAPEYIDANEEE